MLKEVLEFPHRVARRRRRRHRLHTAFSYRRGGGNADRYLSMRNTRTTRGRRCRLLSCSLSVALPLSYRHLFAHLSLSLSSVHAQSVRLVACYYRKASWLSQ